MSLLAALLASILSVTAFAAPNGGTVAAEARDGVVRIVALRPDGYYSLGSGFGIGSAGRNSGLATSARMLSVSDAKEYETYLLELKLIQEIFGIGSLGYGLNLI